MEPREASKAAITAGAKDYPLVGAASFINRRLRLYLSAEQERGLAAGLLIGAAIGGAVLAWTVGSIVRRKGW